MAVHVLARRSHTGCSERSRPGSTAAPPLVRWDGPFTSRDLRLVRVWLAPVQVAGGRLSRTDEVRVAVRWTGTPEGQALRPNPIFDPVYEKTILNWSQARAFAAQPARAALSNPWSGGLSCSKSQCSPTARIASHNPNWRPPGFHERRPRLYRLFYAGGERLPVLNSIPRPVLREVPVEILAKPTDRSTPTMLCISSARPPIAGRTTIRTRCT